ncbi:MAG: bifunctional phosphopantothenoylcysteine decarboxylase/phosphopantothenate--cysteine ligase CoaBC [Thermomicrobiales bacterium]
MTSIRNARIVLGVTGGIAAYKSVDLASKLVQTGAAVDVVLTEGALHFVGEASFGAITKRAVHSGVFETWRDTWHGHITLGQEADIFVIAPATADSLARLATGRADDMLGAAVLASQCPLIVAPAMEHQMYHHPATQANLRTLAERGVHQVGPESGRLASGAIGDGRMAEPLMILGAIRQVLGADGPLRGRRIVVTAGGTRERVDPIRFVGNRSSGLMGYAVTQALIDRGASVVLVTGPVALQPPYGAEVVRVESAREMQAAVRDSTGTADAIIMAAAVSDYRPDRQSPAKIKKENFGDSLTINLVANPDIVAGVAKPGLIKVGFAAETENLVENAKRKLESKALDMIVANDAEKTIGSETSEATLIYRNRLPESLEEMSKSELADVITERIVDLINGRSIGSS